MRRSADTHLTWIGHILRDLLETWPLARGVTLMPTPTPADTPADVACRELMRDVYHLEGLIEEITNPWEEHPSDSELDRLDRALRRVLLRVERLVAAREEAG